MVQQSPEITALILEWYRRIAVEDMVAVAPPKKLSTAKVRLCNFGKPAIAKAVGLIGIDITYTVILCLCKTCLAYEQASKDVPPPLSISPLN